MRTTRVDRARGTGWIRRSCAVHPAEGVARRPRPTADGTARGRAADSAEAAGRGTEPSPAGTGQDQRAGGRHGRRVREASARASHGRDPAAHRPGRDPGRTGNSGEGPDERMPIGHAGRSAIARQLDRVTTARPGRPGPRRPGTDALSRQCAQQSGDLRLRPVAHRPGRASSYRAGAAAAHAHLRPEDRRHPHRPGQ